MAAELSPEEFVRIWQSSESVAEIVERTGVKADCLYSRACHYRKHGVPLKKFRRGMKRPDYVALAKIAKETKSNRQ